MRMICVALVALRALSLHAAEPAVPPSSIRVTGHAVIQVRPDRAQIDVGVVTRASDSRSAVSQNTERAERVLGALRKALGPAAQMQTTGFSVSPEYAPPPRGGGAPGITGYTARNMLRVTVDDLARIGGVLDAVSQAGGNEIQALNFTLRDPLAARNEALRQATADARGQADTVAASLGLRIVRVLSVDTGGERPEPIRPMALAMARADAGPVPIESGSIEVRADVGLAVEVGPAAR